MIQVPSIQFIMAPLACTHEQPFSPTVISELPISQGSMSLNCVGSQTKAGRACVLHALQPQPSFSKVTVLMPASPSLPGPDVRTTSSTLQFLLLHSSPKRRAEDDMRGFSLLSPGFGKSLVEHCRSWISTGRRHLSSVASGAGKSSGCYQLIPLAVKEASVVGFEREKMTGRVWSTPKVFIFFFYA